MNRNLQFNIITFNISQLSNFNLFNNTFIYFTAVNVIFLNIKIIYLLNLSVTVKIELNLFNIINKVKMKSIIII